MFMMYIFPGSELMYTICMQNVYKMFLYEMYLTFRQNFVYKIHTTRFSTKCIPHLGKLLCTFCIQNLAGRVLVYELLSKCGIHFVYILYTSVVYFSYNFYTQNVYAVSVWTKMR